MYKDKDKQREANRQAQARFKAKGITEGITNQGITLPTKTDLGNTLTTTQTVGASSPKRGKDIKCFADLPPDVQVTIDRLSLVDGKIDHTDKAKRTAAAIKYQHLFPHKFDNPGPLTDAELVVVTGKPGDADYNGICTPEWVKERKGAAS